MNDAVRRQQKGLEAKHLAPGVVNACLLSRPRVNECPLCGAEPGDEPGNRRVVRRCRRRRVRVTVVAAVPVRMELGCFVVKHPLVHGHLVQQCCSNQAILGLSPLAVLKSSLQSLEAPADVKPFGSPHGSAISLKHAGQGWCRRRSLRWHLRQLLRRFRGGFLDLAESRRDEFCLLGDEGVQLQRSQVRLANPQARRRLAERGLHEKFGVVARVHP
eukprot:scaffold109054_cov63-Phaeocystis_antarctica.AAC.3